jgi:hypothetical protein
MQHNDIGPQYRPTTSVTLKLQAIRFSISKKKFDWILYSTGPEVLHDTLYRNDMQDISRQETC